MHNTNFEKIKAEKIADTMLAHNSNRLYQTLHRPCSCGYTSARKVEARANMPTLIFLFFLGIIPALIYWYVCRGDDYVCPSCGAISNK